MHSGLHTKLLKQCTKIRINPNNHMMARRKLLHENSYANIINAMNNARYYFKIMSKSLSHTTM